jgi:hypothetical protein
MTPTSSHGSTRRHGSPIQRYARLQHGRFYADFTRDERLNPPVYHCVVQREGSTEILSWSQFRTLEAARSSAQRELQQLAQGEPVDSKTTSLSATIATEGGEPISKVPH